MSVSSIDAPARVDTLAIAHQQSSCRKRWVSMLLLLPLLAYTCVFFALPIGMMFYRAVSNPELLQAFPQAISAMADEQANDSTALPGDRVFDSLEQDFINAPSNAVMGEAARRLNYENSGYRFLVMNTARTYKKPLATPGSQSARERLAAIDERWISPRLWEDFRRASPAYTPYYLLAALDLKQTDQGIAPVEESQRVYLDLTFKTLKIALIVSLLCLLLGFPFAALMVKASPSLQVLLFLAVMLPFWTSLLARTTAWIVVLQDKGIVNTLLLPPGPDRSPAADDFQSARRVHRDGAHPAAVQRAAAVQRDEKHPATFHACLGLARCSSCTRVHSCLFAHDFDGNRFRHLAHVHRRGGLLRDTDPRGQCTRADARLFHCVLYQHHGQLGHGLGTGAGTDFLRDSHLPAGRTLGGHSPDCRPALKELP